MMSCHGTYIIGGSLLDPDPKVKLVMVATLSLY